MPDAADALADDIKAAVLKALQPQVDELKAAIAALVDKPDVWARVDKIEEYLKNLGNTGHQPENL